MLEPGGHLLCSGCSWVLAPAHVARDGQRLELPSEMTEVTPASLGGTACSCMGGAHVAALRLPIRDTVSSSHPFKEGL